MTNWFKTGDNLINLVELAAVSASIKAPNSIAYLLKCGKEVIVSYDSDAIRKKEFKALVKAVEEFMK